MPSGYTADIFGICIEPGNLVVKPQRHSSSVWMTVYFVTGIAPNGKLIVRRLRDNVFGYVNQDEFKRQYQIEKNNSVLLSDGQAVSLIQELCSKWNVDLDDVTKTLQGTLSSDDELPER